MDAITYIQIKLEKIAKADPKTAYELFTLNVLEHMLKADLVDLRKCGDV